MRFRTDLAIEAKQIWENELQQVRQLEGVTANTEVVEGFQTTRVEITSQRGAKVLCKPIGTYITMDLDDYIRREDTSFDRGAAAISQILGRMLHFQGDECVLIAGLGNETITPDSIGPRTTKFLMATRHLAQQAPELFKSFRSVSVFETGVLGTTGIESAELIKAVADRIHPDCIIVVDALASASMHRLCRTVQFSNTGIVPGSGVGNSRAALNRDTLGVDVIAIGVPTVVDAATLVSEAAEATGSQVEREQISKECASMMVTPREIDVRAEEISKLIGYGVNLALHNGLTIEDVNMFVS